MTNEELTAIERRATAATMGPWDGTKNSGVVSKHTRDTVFETGCGCCTENDLSAEDAAFIAAARVDVPALVAEVRTLRSERDAELAAFPALHDALIIAEGQRDQARAERDKLRAELAQEKLLKSAQVPNRSRA